jgi:PhzF family phenazine biosynthesis protein
MNTHRMLCFGRDNKSGNAAVVVENGTLTETDRLKFAQQQNANATVFVEANAAGETQLDYYYPHTRSPLCLHATLATSAVFFERYPDREQIQFVTSMRGQALKVSRVEGHIFIALSPQRCPALSPDSAAALLLLRAAQTNVIGAPRLASVGSPKLLMEVAGQAVLDALQPDLAAVSNWGRQHGISGIYAYCRLGDDVYAGRNFNHLEPRFEDAATGVAAGALALSLEKSITLLQGDALGQPCTLLARYEEGQVQVGGRAVRSAGQDAD